jgi:hypothetical protein
MGQDRETHKDKKHMPEAGPSADDRGPVEDYDPAAARASKAQRTKDVHARIIGVSIVDGMSRIAIAAGPDQGVDVGTPGETVNEHFKSAQVDFEVTEVRGGRVSFALVHLTPDQLKDTDVLFKASAPEKPKGGGHHHH